MVRFPQVARAIPVREKIPLAELPKLGAVVRGIEDELGDEGRVVIRYSGTEAKLRVMLEGPDAAALEDYAGRIGEVASAELGPPPAA
jgi:phosphoglucosamine mutase